MIMMDVLESKARMQWNDYREIIVANRISALNELLGSLFKDAYKIGYRQAENDFEFLNIDRFEKRVKELEEQVGKEKGPFNIPIKMCKICNEVEVRNPLGVCVDCYSKEVINE